MKVHYVDLAKETIGPPVTVRAYLTQTVAEFLEVVAKVLDVPLASMRCVRECYYNDLRLLANPSRTLRIEGFIKSNKVGSNQFKVQSVSVSIT